MTYRVVYNGIDVEESTLNGAIEYAKTLITNDAGPMTAWTVEHDELINDWFVQGTQDDSTVTYTATVAGPNSMGPVQKGRLAETQHPDGEQLRATSFTGITPAEVFGRATAWLAASPVAVGVADVNWHFVPDAAEPLDLTIYYYLS